jgi:AcrR family transcriptional regulator
VTTEPRTPRGTRTRQKLLSAAEHVFATLGYHDASIVKITEEAGVGLGTFYLYFSGKQEIFDEVVRDLNRRVRAAMSEGAAGAASRLEAERGGFRAFFRFTAEHPELYRIIRQAEFVSPQAMREHYESIVEGYIEGLTTARERGDVRELDPVVTAWALMGAGELIGMRWVLWEQGERPETGVPEPVFESLMDLIEVGLGARQGTLTGQEDR